MVPEDHTMPTDHSEDDAIARGGVATPFPWKLHDMLEDSHKEGNTWIASWADHGRSFTVHKPKAFVEKIMPTFFNQTKYASFQRQLNLYGFSRLTHGTDKGAYFHRCFVRGERALCRGMIRQKIKGTKVRRTLAPDEEPNFTAEPQVVPSSTTVTKKTTKQQQRAEHQSKVVQSALAITETFCDELLADEAPAFTIPTTVSASNIAAEDEAAGSDLEDMDGCATMMMDHKGGDLLFFEGLPFHYLEHMEEVPPKGTAPTQLPQPSALTKKLLQPNQLPTMNVPSYFPRDSLQSLMRVDPQAIMGSFRRTTPQP